MEYNLDNLGTYLSELNDACAKLKSVAETVFNIPDTKTKKFAQEIVDIRIQVETEAKELMNYINDILNAEEFNEKELNNLYKKIYDYKGSYYWAEAFNKAGDYENGRLMQDLQNRKIVIFNRKKGGVLRLKYVDGEIIGIDSNGGEKIYSLKELAKMGGKFHAYASKELKSTELNSASAYSKYETYDCQGRFYWSEAFKDGKLIQSLQKGKIIRVKLKNGEYLFLTEYNEETGEITAVDSNDNSKIYTLKDIKKFKGPYCIYTTEIKLSDTQKSFIECVKKIDKKTADEKWTYGPTREFFTLDEALNYYKMQCGSLVSMALVMCGVFSEDDLIKEYKDGHTGKQWNSPGKIRKAMQEKNFEKITDKYELQPGDIICYKEGSAGWGYHIEIFAGYDKDGNALIYSSGDDKDIQKEGPQAIRNISGTWEAYRVPES